MASLNRTITPISRTIGMTGLLSLALAPIANRIERSLLQHRLQSSNRTIDVLNAQIKNDIKAIRYEQNRQANMNARLNELGGRK